MNDVQYAVVASPEIIHQVVMCLLGNGANDLLGAADLVW